MFIPFYLSSIFKNPNYISALQMSEKQKKHENVIPIWDEPTKKSSTQNEIINAMWPRSRHNLVVMWFRLSPHRLLAFNLT